MFRPIRAERVAPMAGFVRAWLRRAAAVAAALVVIPVALVVTAQPAAALPLQMACPAGTLVGTTYTLTADCAVTEPVTVPNGWTLDGADRMDDQRERHGCVFVGDGGIVTNELPGGSMNIQNLTVTGPDAGFTVNTISGDVVYGIFFNDASGTVTNVLVDNIFQQQNPLSPANQTGRAIRADALTGGAHGHDHRNDGHELPEERVRGPRVGGLADDHGHHRRASRGHRLICWDSLPRTGSPTSAPAEPSTPTRSTAVPLRPRRAQRTAGNSTAVLMSGAVDVTVSNNTIIGDFTDIGISVSAASTGIILAFNDVTRTPPAAPDPTGIGIDVAADPTARPH